MGAVWNRINTVLLLLLLLAVIGGLATAVRGGPLDPPAPPGSTDGVRLSGTPITGPTTISAPGHYYLTRDIVVSGAVVAIYISADNVSLDLGGFTIDGDDTIGSYGIHVTGPPHRDITISNGTVRDFQFGVDVGNGWRARIDRVQANSNLRGFHLGPYSILTECSAIENAEMGIYVPAAHSRVQDCVVFANANDGIAVFGNGNLIERNQALFNGLTGGEDLRDAGTEENTQNTFRENVVKNLVLKIDGGATAVDNVCYGDLQNPGGNIANATDFFGNTDHLNVGC